jgi:hypothetical protein
MEEASNSNNCVLCYIVNQIFFIDICALLLLVIGEEIEHEGETAANC